MATRRSPAPVLSRAGARALGGAPPASTSSPGRRAVLLGAPLAWTAAGWGQAGSAGAAEARRDWGEAGQAVLKAADAGQAALAAPSVEEEERLLSVAVTLVEPVSSDVPGRDEVLARALGDRGNARSRQGRFAEALGDYDASHAMLPSSPDPLLNKGAVLEQMGRFQDAIGCYEQVLRLDKNDPAGWNNLANAKLGLADYKGAEEGYLKAIKLSPSFSFARCNWAIAIFAGGGRDDQAMRELRSLTRRYPDFADARAALVAALWATGERGAADEEWERVLDLDARYKDMAWLESGRRWPPRLVQAMQDFRGIR